MLYKKQSKVNKLANIENLSEWKKKVGKIVGEEWRWLILFVQIEGEKNITGAATQQQN